MDAEQGRLLPLVLDPDVVPAVAAEVCNTARSVALDPAMSLLDPIGAGL